MKICVINPKCSAESAKELADKMGWDCVNPFAEGRRDFSMYLGVFNYGCNRTIHARNVVNKTKSVATCISKVATFEVFKAAGIPTVNYYTRRIEVPAKWDCVVIRDKIDGNKAEGLHYYYQDERVALNKTPDIPIGALYTEGFEHEYELRIVVFCGVVVGCYKKVDNNGQWDFVPFTRSGKDLLEDAVKAAKALDIDYVGFDVLINNKGEHVFLEANSGPILTDEVADAIAAYVA